MKRYALISVADKREVGSFAKIIVDAGFTILSTGGTLRALKEAGVDAMKVSEFTGSPEVFEGRVKSLHPRIHGGILHRRDVQAHVDEARTHDIAPIDLVVVNLYPFEATVAAGDATWQEAIENIDIGGPTMIRAAAKNSDAVAIVCSPDDYAVVGEQLTASGSIDDKTRKELALKAFRHTARYDAAIARWLGEELEGESATPAELHEPQRRQVELRYGENPHQSAGLYQLLGEKDYAGASVLQGKALSYNNLVDLDAAVDAVREFEDPAVVVVKHTNPCGVGRDSDKLATAYERALAGDPVSAFGGIVAANRSVDGELAAMLAERFLEVVAAPSFTAEARERFAAKKNLRLVTTAGVRAPARRIRNSAFGLLVQAADPAIGSIAEDWEVVTDRAPTSDEEVALRFLWRVCKHVKSNAIVIGSHERTYGVGAGQMSRVDAVELAVKKSTGELQGSALASDAFFPFRDGLDAAAKAGVRAVIQPGGSKRDSEVIEAANEHGIAMVFTGHRHFRH